MPLFAGQERRAQNGNEHAQQTDKNDAHGGEHHDLHALCPHWQAFDLLEDQQGLADGARLHKTEQIEKNRQRDDMK
jgi:hypothetical protein